MSGAESTNKLCGCKGIRTCLLCEEIGGLNTARDSALNIGSIKKDDSELCTYLYCDECKVAYKNSDNLTHPDHQGESLSFTGIFLMKEFLSENEEHNLITEIDRTTFVVSQSGRRKQDFGPKANFKKRKLKTDCFTGLPSYSKEYYERFKDLDILRNFIPVEMCNLEYAPERGSAIDPHFDDFWLWGDRLVTINLVSETILTFTHDSEPGVCVDVPLPRRSLVVVNGAARYKWKHSILRTNIHQRRVAMTFRELSNEFLQDGDNESIRDALVATSLSFQGQAVAGTVAKNA